MLKTESSLGFFRLFVLQPGRFHRDEALGLMGSRCMAVCNEILHEQHLMEYLSSYYVWNFFGDLVNLARDLTVTNACSVGRLARANKN